MSPRLPAPEILFQDARLAILNKPPGLASHAGPRGGASAEDWFALLSRRKDGPWLAHRLDADTSGCLVVALRKAALVEIQAAFAAGRVGKTYWAVCRGHPPGDVRVGSSGLVDARLIRRSASAGWRMQVDPSGAAAATAWRVLGLGDGSCWLELSPRTGRTHQVRVHCATLGCPVVGDPVYGEGPGPLHLLARSIRLPLEPAAEAVAAPPPHMRPTLGALGWDGALSPPGTTR